MQLDCPHNADFAAFNWRAKFSAGGGAKRSLTAIIEVSALSSSLPSIPYRHA